MIQNGKFLLLFLLSVMQFAQVSNAAPTTIEESINKHYEKMDSIFTRIAKSPALKSTRLSNAERLFVTELRKNQAFYALIRTNSKGKIISAVVRGKKADRPNENVTKEKWFQTVKKSKKDYYAVTKEGDLGRYYLVWSKPIIKNSTFIGAITVKIDLWDSFYGFSNSVYYPFLIRMNDSGLFSHKWNDAITFKEERLKIPGIKKITVRYIQEKKSAEPVSASTDSSKTSVPDSITGTAVSENSKKERSPIGLLLAVIALVAGGGAVSFIIISKRRRDNFLKSLDEE